MRYRITVETHRDDDTWESTVTFKGGPKPTAQWLRDAADQLDRGRTEAGRGLTTAIRSSADVRHPNAVSRMGFAPVVAETVKINLTDDPQADTYVELLETP